jgi:hypothetical protein
MIHLGDGAGKICRLVEAALQICRAQAQQSDPSQNGAPSIGRRRSTILAFCILIAFMFELAYWLSYSRPGTR